MGLPLFFVPLNTIAYGDLPPGKSNNASALINLMRNLGGSIGISVAVTMLDRRTQMHQDRLVVAPDALRRPVPPGGCPDDRHDVAGHGGGVPQARSRAFAMIYQGVSQQALMLSYLDVFKVMMIGCLRRRRRGAPAPPSEAG